jgi:hypothetical protein
MIPLLAALVFSLLPMFGDSVKPTVLSSCSQYTTPVTMSGKVYIYGKRICYAGTGWQRIYIRESSGLVRYGNCAARGATSSVWAKAPISAVGGQSC